MGGFATRFSGAEISQASAHRPLFADFLCLSARLVIEVDGGQHDEAKNYDEARTRFIAAKGHRLILYWNNDVLTNLDGVLADIASHLSPSPSQG